MNRICKKSTPSGFFSAARRTIATTDDRLDDRFRTPRRSALFQTSVKDGFTRGPYRSSNNYRKQNVSYPIGKATNRGFLRRNRARRTWISHHLSPNFCTPLQTLFPCCKIAITSHCLFEKRPIVDCHRGNEREEHGFHTIEAQTVYPLQTLFPACKIAIFLSHRSLLKILCIDKIGSRPRRILCVQKIAARPRGILVYSLYR